MDTDVVTAGERDSAAPPIPTPTPSVLAGTRVSRELLQRLAGLAFTAGGPRDAIEVRAPFTGEVIGTVPRALPTDAEEAVCRARAAQADWATRGIAERARIMLRFHDLLLARREEILDIVQLESGKTRLHAFEELADVANVTRYYARKAESFLAPTRRRGAVPGLTRVVEMHHPLGVVGFIVPWNYPLTLAISDTLPALMAGNTAIAKPDQHTPFTALWVASLLYEAGLPRDALLLLTGMGTEIGPPLIDRVDFLMFTGSTRTGKIVAQQAASRLIGISLELGGKNPMIVCADADIERAVDGAVRGCFVGAGQVCVSIERIYVARSIHERFVRRFAERARAVPLVRSFSYETGVGSLAFPAQLERVEAHVRDAERKGATIICGGRHRPDVGPLFYEPTIVGDVGPDMLLASEETFGPVVAVYPFDDVDEAIVWSNASPYGLNASVWSRDEREAIRIASCIHAGTVNVNEAYSATWGSVDAPIGGFKESGVSRRHGREGLLKYTEVQTIAAQRLIPIAPKGPVTPARFAALVTRLLQLMRRIPGM